MESKNNKYFTPDIEDIRVGYECEILYPYKTVEFGKKLVDEWEPYTFEAGEIYACDKGLALDYYKIRTLYLTKEQIEAERWGQGFGLAEFEKTKPIIWSVRNKNNQTQDLIYNLESKELVLSINNEIVFKGQCKDINTFRYICKLLNI